MLFRLQYVLGQLSKIASDLSKFQALSRCLRPTRFHDEEYFLRAGSVLNHGTERRLLPPFDLLHDVC